MRSRDQMPSDGTLGWVGLDQKSNAPVAHNLTLIEPRVSTQWCPHEPTGGRTAQFPRYGCDSPRHSGQRFLLPLSKSGIARYTMMVHSGHCTVPIRNVHFANYSLAHQIKTRP